MRFRRGREEHDAGNILGTVQLLDRYLFDDDRFLHCDLQWKFDQNCDRTEYISDISVFAVHHHGQNH